MNKKEKTSWEVLSVVISGVIFFALAQRIQSLEKIEALLPIVMVCRLSHLSHHDSREDTERGWVE